MNIKIVLLLSVLSYSQSLINALPTTDPIVESAAPVPAPGSLPSSNGELIFSHVLFRHGDRTPVMFYPTDPYSSPSNWPVGFGQLTNRGKQQHFTLGQWLRQRYGNILLPEEYSENDIYVRSTDVDRTLASAYSNLAGLYPPKNGQVWNPDLPWQPIPVHTIKESEDYVIGGVIPPCPVYDLASANLYKSPLFTKLSVQIKDLYDYLTEFSGLPVNTSSPADAVSETMLIRDTLFCESSYDMVLPEWTKRIFPEEKEMETVSMLAYVLPSYTKKLAKFRSGYLFQEILQRSADKSQGILSPDRSVWIYSAHDTVLANILYALRLSDNQFVQYAACILFELRNTATGPALEIYYKKNSTTLEATPLYIPNCGYSCSLDTLEILYHDILPTQDFQTACQL